MLLQRPSRLHPSRLRRARGKRGIEWLEEKLASRLRLMRSLRLRLARSLRLRLHPLPPL